jgi:hypothetical protein
MVAFTVSLYRAYKPFQQKKAIVEQNTIAQGVLVDGVHVGGMSRTDAAAALQKQETVSGGLWLTVQADGETWVITPKELPLERNTQAVLETAYAVGRQGSRETIASTLTPFEYRYQHLYHTATSPVRLNTSVTYSAEKLWELVRIIENRVSRPAEDAQVATFDFASRSFTFTEDRPGAKLDADALYRKIADLLDRQQYTATLTVQSEPIMPKVTRAELMNTFVRISTYTTTTTTDPNRNNNVNLACQAITGTAVMPGKPFPSIRPRPAHPGKRLSHGRRHRRRHHRGRGGRRRVPGVQHPVQRRSHGRPHHPEALAPHLAQQLRGKRPGRHRELAQPGFRIPQR